MELGRRTQDAIATQFPPIFSKRFVLGTLCVLMLGAVYSCGDDADTSNPTTNHTNTNPTNTNNTGTNNEPGKPVSSASGKRLKRLEQRTTSGELITHFDFHYNSRNELDKSETYFFGNTLGSYTIYSHNSKSLLTSHHTYNPDGSLLGRHDFEYDSSTKRPSKSILYHASNLIISWDAYTFFPNGNPKTRVSYACLRLGPDGLPKPCETLEEFSPTHETVFSYDDHGRRTTQTTHNISLKGTHTHTYSYNADGTINEAVETEATGYNEHHTPSAYKFFYEDGESVGTASDLLTLLTL